MKPLSEQEWKEQIENTLQDLVFDTPNHYGYPPDFEPDFKSATDKLVDLILSDRKAYGKKIIDRLEKAYDAALFDVHELDLTEYLVGGDFHYAIRFERQRNQGEG